MSLYKYIFGLSPIENEILYIETMSYWLDKYMYCEIELEIKMCKGIISPMPYYCMN